MNELKVLFFGLGSIGKRHATILHQKYNTKLYAIRTGLGLEHHNLPVTEFSTFEDAINIHPDICFITNPTFLHIPTAMGCIKYGIPIFMEKPISNTYKGINNLSSEIERNHLLVYIAYNMRFHPVIDYLRQFVLSNEEKPIYFRVICSSYLPSWRPNQDYRLSYSSKKEMGGGVILDVSHEIDYIDWIFGGIERIDGWFGNISNLEVNSEDIAEMQFKCNDSDGSLHMNYFSHHDERIIQIFYNSMYIEGNLLTNKITTYKNGKAINIKMMYGDRDTTFIKQMDYFLEQYKNNNYHLMNNFRDASKIFKKMVEFKEIHGKYISR